MRRLRYGIVYFAALMCFFLNTSANEIHRLRDPKTPCGLYLTFMADTTMGAKIANLNETEIREVLLGLQQELAPRLRYVRKDTREPYTNEKELREAIEKDEALPLVDIPALYLVGVPLLGKEKRGLLHTTREAVEELSLDFSLQVKPIGRPIKPEYGRPWLTPLEQVNYWAQRLLYLFPLPQDYQPPVPKEIKTAMQKLATSNTFEQMVIMTQQPLARSLLNGMVNYGNSTMTAVYRKIISNWFGRSGNEIGRIMRNIIITSFFTVELYWWSQILHWEDFSKIATLEGWEKMALTKWSALAFSVLWRYYYYRAIHTWEVSMEKRGRKEAGRRTAAKFELAGTLIGTPAFLIATTARPEDMPTWVPHLLGHDIMTLTPAHGVMAGVGALFAMFYYGVFKMDPWVERFDKVDKALYTFGQNTHLIPIAHQTKDLAISFWRTLFPKKAFSVPSVHVPLRELIQFDSTLEQWLEKDPALLETIQKSPLIQQLLAKDQILRGALEKHMMEPAVLAEAP